jgi:general secretion pathway protein G
MSEQSSPDESTPPVARKKTSLFTILLVIFLLFIIAGIVLPSAHFHRGPIARVGAAKAQIAAFGTALGEFKVDTGSFPRGANGLKCLIQRPLDATNWLGPYLQSAVPKDPWGHDYFYQFPGRRNPQGYDLSAIGPDGQVYGNWTQK